MVLFVFAMMLLNLGRAATEQERQWLKPRMWRGPGILAFILLAEVVYVLTCVGWPAPAGGVVEPRQVGAALFGPYVLGVELASLVLLAALLGAYHLGRRTPPSEGGGP
jgi:NADH-quinone oxidoreductase subunit J